MCLIVTGSRTKSVVPDAVVEAIAHTRLWLLRALPFWIGVREDCLR